jgi:hypothetical protein
MKQAIRTLLFCLISSLLLLSTAGAAEHDGYAKCDCAADVQPDLSLPMSHPVNRCALNQNKGVSWLSWFSGRSKSSQFHYLDLLELLTRNNHSESVTEHSS